MQRLLSLRLTLKDPVSAGTHMAGCAAGVVGLVLLVLFSAGDAPKTAAMAIYGGALVALFGASSLYHGLDLGTRGNLWLRRLDHTAIFLLIAGSYVPPLFHLLEGTWRTAMLSAVGGLTALGILFKLVWVDCPRWLSVGVYLTLGWIVLIPAHKIFPQLTPAAAAWLVAGGLAYSVGALVYVRRWPDPVPDRFGFHEVWHLFVLAGAAAHFGFTWQLLDAPYPPF